MAAKTLSELFNEIVDAIHEKDGRIDGIAAKDFPQRIRNLSINDNLNFKLRIDTPPTISHYTEGDDISIDGLSVSAVFGESTIPLQLDCVDIFPRENLQLSDTAMHISLDLNGAVASVDYPIEVHDVIPVYGVCWTYNESSPALERLTPETDPNNLVTVTITEEPVAAVGDVGGSSPFDALMPWAGMKKCNIVDNRLFAWEGEEEFSLTEHDTMIYIPSFVYEVIDDPSKYKRYWYISPYRHHSMLNQHPGSDTFISRYGATKTGNSVSNASKAWKTPDNWEPILADKGPNWIPIMLETWAALQMLYLVEYASFDSQEKIGLGRWASPILKTGATDLMTYHTGATDSTNASMVQYRGVENVYGDLMVFIGNVTMKGRRPAITSKGSTTTKDYKYSLPSSTRGYQQRLGYDPTFPWAFIPTTAGGGAHAYVTDYCTSNSGERAYQVGGYVGSQDNGLSVGFFYINTYDDATATVGLRLEWDRRLQDALHEE